MSVPHFRFALLALLMILASLFVPRTAHTKSEYMVTYVGYPTPFVQQSYRSYNPPFPYRYAISSPWEIPMKFLWGNFIFSWILTLLSLEAIWFLIQFYKGHLIAVEKRSKGSMILVAEDDRIKK